MATKSKLSGSPSEDYDPLLCDHDSGLIENGHGYDDDTHDGIDSMSPSSSMEERKFHDAYIGSPPINFRERVRSKERSRKNTRQSRDLKKEIKWVEQVLPGFAAREEFKNMNLENSFNSLVIDSASSSELESSMDQQQFKDRRSRRESQKGLKTTRQYERDYKHNSGSDLTSLENSMESPAFAKPVPYNFTNIDSPNRFFSLPSKMVGHAGHGDQSSTTCNIQRKHSVANIRCPKEREDFYKIFSQLVNMGNTSKKEKDSSSKVTPYVRQQSIEQEVWQTRLDDLMWLELQAWHQGKTIKDQDKYLCSAREGIPDILQAIMDFKFLPSDSNISSKGSSIHSNLSLVLENSDRVEVPHCTSELLDSIEKQKEALKQVRSLLDQLEEVEKLYPNTRALGRAYPIYTSHKFQQRLNTMCLWMNITEELGRKLQLMAQVLYIDQYEGLAWPWIDYESPKQKMYGIRNSQDMITPVIPDPSEEFDCDADPSDINCSNDYLSHSNSGDIAFRNVRFAFGQSGSGTASPDVHLFASPLAPSDASTPRKQPFSQSLSNSSNLSRISYSSMEQSMEDLTQISIYRYFVDRTLKKSGLKKLFQRMTDLLHNALTRGKTALQEPLADVYSENAKDKTPATLAKLSSYHIVKKREEGYSETSGLPDSCDDNDDDAERVNFDTMNLPSFRPTYLFLVRIPLDVVHECLRLRLEQRLEQEPSLLSVRQLIRECHEVLLYGVHVKQYCQRMVVQVFQDSEPFEMDLEQFEVDMKEMLQVYFNYVQSWMCELQNLHEMSKSLKNVLEEEWNFTKRVCPHIRGGEADAGNHFCKMESFLLGSISDFLENGMDDCIDTLYDVTIDPEDTMEMSLRHNKSTEFRQAIIKTCRKFKHLFHEARQRAYKAVGFAKMLRKDLEMAADFHICVTASDLLHKLQDTGHVKLQAPHSAGYMMFIPNHISDDMPLILQLLNATCGREESSLGSTASDVSGAAGYLLLVKCESCEDKQVGCPDWSGPKIRVEPTAETTIALSHIEVEGLLLVVTNSLQLSSQRKEFEKLVGGVVQLVSENTSCHAAISESLLELKHSALQLRSKVAEAIKQVDQKLSLEDIPEMDDLEKINIQKLYRETLHQCYNFGFEYHNEVTRLVSGEMRTKMARNLVNFATQWMAFVVEKCERGRGRRPRWANQGFDFLLVACDPRVLAVLTEEEFTNLKKSINSCVLHVVGDKNAPGSPSAGYRVSSPDPARHVSRFMSCPEPFRELSKPSSTPSIASEPPTPLGTLNAYNMDVKSKTSPGSDSLLVDDGGLSFEARTHSSHNFSDLTEDISPPISRMKRVQDGIVKLEQERTNKLYKEKVIGIVKDRKLESDLHYQNNIRKVKFKWQRGIKIGEGSFGKVYTAYNRETGELMAMKEMRYQPNDHQTIKHIADEIKRFEGIAHENLVRYYGVEVHRDEMLIFMELCTDGTLEDISKQGVPEPLVRKYTRDILLALAVLHEHGIIHRDIKGGNIFLTPDGLKLGDFGSSVKLKSHTTMQGEVHNRIGTTTQYSAPEVVTDREGHGRAADIWSLGCVVLEMITGKKPWHGMETVRIIWQLGTGVCPPVPEYLSEEGQDFLRSCFQCEPKDRPTAHKLLDHPFVKVYSEDDLDDSIPYAIN